jgi:hypothetical protein
MESKKKRIRCEMKWFVKNELTQTFQVLLFGINKLIGKGFPKEGITTQGK